MASIRVLRSLAPALRSVSTKPFAARQLCAVSRTAVTGTSSPVRCFSLSARALKGGETDLELTSKLQEELQFEKEAAQHAAALPEFLAEFQSNGIWKIEEKEGHDEVVLHRKFGNEDIRVVFSIADIDTSQEQPEPELDDEGNPISTEAEGEGEGQSPAVYPIRCSITITKPQVGTISIDSIADDGNFVIENVGYYQDSKVATDMTVAADWTRRGTYIGPQFDHLDVGLQEAFEKYLEERNIGQSLASFIPEYAEHKEQQEYTQWLSNVHKFVSN